MENNPVYLSLASLGAQLGQSNILKYYITAEVSIALKKILKLILQTHKVKRISCASLDHFPTLLAILS